MKISKGINIRPKGGKFFVFLNYRGMRLAFQFDTEEQAKKVADYYVELQRKGEWAKIFEEAKREKAEKPQEEKKQCPTLAEYYKRFEKVYLDTSTRQGTRDRYATSFAHILPVLGDVPLCDITRETIKDFVAHMVTKRYQRHVKGKTYPNPKKKRKPIITWTTKEVPYSKTSIRIVLNELCSLFSHAVEENVVPGNPVLNLGKFYKQTKDVHEEIQPLTAAEVSAFLAAVLDRAWSKPYYPVFLTALHTGMRASELIGLQWGDCDFHGKFFLLRRQFTRGRIEPTKTGKARRVDMSDAVATELQALKKQRQKEYLASGSNTIPGWIFINGEGNPLDYYNLKRRHFEKCLEHAKLRRIRFHDLRHTYATLLLMQGESPAYIKDQLGHSSIKVTVDIYGHWIPGSNREAVNRLPLPALVSENCNQTATTA